MKKILCVIRISTEKQEIQDQKAEMIKFCKDCGYDEERIEFIEGIGASAIKLNQAYIDMVNAIKDYIYNGIAEAVAVWHINRLGRNDDILIQLKNLFITNKIQFYCKNPNLRLLNDDLTVNAGAELAYSLFATMCKQDMEEKKAKFRRSKKWKQERGQYCGGYISYGYKVGENNLLEVDEEQAKVVKEIFELYRTGKYSYATLAQELKDRGITYTNQHCARPVRNAYFRKDGLNKMLSNPAYIGIDRNLKYPAIISEELFRACEEIRKTNNIKIDKGKHYRFGAKLIKCPCCGRYLYPDVVRYQCYMRNKKRLGYLSDEYCDSDLGIRIDIMDGILWNVASTQHMNYLLAEADSVEPEYRKEIEVLKQKVKAAEDKLKGTEDKKSKILDLYVDGHISKPERTARLQKVETEAEEIRKASLQYKEQIDRLQKLIDSKNDFQKEADMLAALLNGVIDETDEIKMYDIVHKHIKEVTLKRFDFEKKYRRNGEPQKPNGVEITIHLMNGKTIVFAFLPFVRTRDNLYRLIDGKWVQYDFEPIIREDHKAYTEISRNKK